MKEEQLNEKIFDVAEELNQVLGLDPEIQTENVTAADVKQKVTEAAELIDPENDEFSKTTTKVLQAMGLIADDSAHNEDVLESTNPQPKAESEEEAKETEEEEYEEEEEEPEEPEESLVDQVNATKKRKQLKQIVSDNPEVFADVKAEIKNLKDASSLKEAMLEVLEGSSETSTPEPKTEQEEEELTFKKAAKAPAKKKGKGQTKTKKSVVLEMTNSKKGTTVDEIAKKIVDEGIDPDFEKNKKTVRLWLRKLDISSTGEGKNLKYKQG